MVLVAFTAMACSPSPNTKTIVNPAHTENDEHMIDVCHLDVVVCPDERQPTVEELLSEYFAPQDVARAIKIIECESRFNANAHNNNPSTGDDSYGLAQINILNNLFDERLRQARTLGYDGPATREDLGAWLLIPENNIRFFAFLHKKHGWSPWSCHKKIQKI